MILLEKTSFSFANGIYLKMLNYYKSIIDTSDETTINALSDKLDLRKLMYTTKQNATFITLGEQFSNHLASTFNNVVVNYCKVNKFAFRESFIKSLITVIVPTSEYYQEESDFTEVIKEIINNKMQKVYGRDIISVYDLVFEIEDSSDDVIETCVSLELDEDLYYFHLCDTIGIRIYEMATAKFNKTVNVFINKPIIEPHYNLRFKIAVLSKFVLTIVDETYTDARYCATAKATLLYQIQMTANETKEYKVQLCFYFKNLCAATDLYKEEHYNDFIRLKVDADSQLNLNLAAFLEYCRNKYKRVNLSFKDLLIDMASALIHASKK